LTASFIAKAGVGVEKVSAAQRYPWNGMVDLAFTITGDAGTAYQVSFAAKDMAGGTNLVMKTVMSESGGLIEAALPPGTYRVVWNAGADLPDGFKAERVAITVEAK